MSERTDKLETIFHAAAELTSAEQRASYLAAACQGDPALRREVEALLKAAPIGEDLFQGCEQAQAPHANSPALADAKLIGSSIGQYKLLEIIGEGGMGVVYMAEQREPVVRKVALKIIKLGMDTRQVVARFEAERQALALMDHPNIAQVLGGGATETGRPYFVMELVQGVPITEFCAANRLTVEDRLKLFTTVCQAIQSAHQKGIIHRDLKPSNVLVTMHNGAPHPMVIDFGVAKATGQKLTEKTLFTNFATMIGTPAYMSPEQAEMSKLDVDTRSDIYSLGVLLYELLTGSPPFPEERLRSVAYGEMQRIIVEEEPERPSTRRRKTAVTKPEIPNPKSEIDPDLDWIVMKCLEKDRNRRYETANGLATDIKRHLANEPVVARPPSRLYEFQKTIRRHKVGFAAAGAIALALVVGLGISTWSLMKEKTALQRALAAEKEQARLRQEADASRLQAEVDKNTAQAEAAKNKQVARFLANMIQRLVDTLEHQGEYAEAAKVVRATLAVLQEKTLAEEELSILRAKLILVFELGGDKEELEKFYQELKQIGETSPMSRVSWLFDRGLGGVPKDEKKAAEWIQRASEIRPEYLYWMGFRYERGKGVPRDEAEALRWYRKAAEQGVGPAQIILGNMYNHGRGVPKDETEAKKWFQKVEQADLDAMRRIAWWHAVSKVPELRDGMNAIVFAERLVALTSRTNANYLDTLACAYAETGQFEIAVNVQKEAISRLTNEDKSTYETQLKLFEARTPRRN